MGKILYEENFNFAGGVITNARPDTVKQLGAYPRGRNTQLINIGPQSATVATRPGVTLMNPIQISGGGTVLGQFEYRKYTGSGFSPFHLIITDQGKFKIMNDSDGSLTDADLSNATPFTAGQNYPDSAVANNDIYIVNGVDTKKYNGTNVQNVGIVAPVAPVPADQGSSGSCNGAYDFAVTYYDSATGQESSLSPFGSVTVTNHKINVPLVASSDAQVDTIRIYIRKGTLSGSFFRLTSGTTPSVNGNGGFSNSNATIVVDVSDTILIALTNLAPNISENNPPPTLDKIEFHQSRLFAVSPTNPSTLLYSKISSLGVESFDPSATIPVNVNDGDRITALQSATEMLIIFKKRSIYILVGEYPSWELRLLTNEVGATSHLGVISYNGTTYFYSMFGPCAWQPGGAPQLLAQPNIANSVDQNATNFNIIDKVAVGFHEPTLRLFWSIPQETSSRNNILLPYSIILGVFEADQWNVIDIASLATVVDANGNKLTYFGDYNGRIFRFDGTDIYVDGVPSGTVTGTGQTTSYASNTLTDSAASFYTTGNGLAQLYLYAYDANGQNLQRKRIGSNTGTVITLDSGVTWDTTPDTSWTYVVGAIDFELDYGWSGMGVNLWKKDYEFLFLDLVPPSTIANNFFVYVDLFNDFNVTPFRTLFTSIGDIGAQWDVSLWDSGAWGGGQPIVHTRQRMAMTGRTVLARVRCITSNAPIAVTRMAIAANLQSMKS